MASYTVTGTRRDIQVVSPTEVRDVQIVSALTAPHGVAFQVPVPLDAFQSQQADSFVEPVAEGIIGVLEHRNVEAVRYEQVLDRSGLRKSVLIATVTVPTPVGMFGPFTTEVEIDFATLALPAAERQPIVDYAVYQAVVLLAQQAGVPPPPAVPPPPPSSGGSYRSPPPPPPEGNQGQQQQQQVPDGSFESPPPPPNLPLPAPRTERP